MNSSLSFNYKKKETKWEKQIKKNKIREKTIMRDKQNAFTFDYNTAENISILDNSNGDLSTIHDDNIENNIDFSINHIDMLNENGMVNILNEKIENDDMNINVNPAFIEFSINPINMNDEKNMINNIKDTNIDNKLLPSDIEFSINPINVNDEKNIINNIKYKDTKNINFYEKYNEPNNYINLNVDLLNKNLKNIVCVYQEKYYNNKNCTGFGDFLRGCYFVLQFCEMHNFHFKLIINHPIVKFLNFYNDFHEKININISSRIQFFENTNFEKKIDQHGFIENIQTSNIYNDFIKYLLNTTLYNDTIYIHNISFPINKISQKNRIILQKILEPSYEMKKYVYNTLSENQLHNYCVIHIRCGDNFLINNEEIINYNRVNIIINNIQNIMEKNEGEFLLLADNNIIKSLIVNKISNIKVIYKNITHFGEGIVLEEDKVKNTLLDFYLLSLSKAIYAFSTYEHGSGFSKWCAETYNIPYKCKYIGKLQ